MSMRRPVRKPRWLRRFVSDDCGTQIIEFAIAMPVMLMLLGSVAEFGRFFYTYTTLTSAVRAGARHAYPGLRARDRRRDADDALLGGGRAGERRRDHDHAERSVRLRRVRGGRGILSER